MLVTKFVSPMVTHFVWKTLWLGNSKVLPVLN